jgi:hypothetical protein
MENMENVDHGEGEDHNNVHVVVEEKGEYELARDTHVASITYLKKSHKEAQKQL